MRIKELTEAVEEISRNYSRKYRIHREANWYMLKLQEEVGELTQSYLMMSGKGRTKNKKPTELRRDFEQEIADVLCHVLLLAKSNKVDIERAVKTKWLKWKKTPPAKK